MSAVGEKKIYITPIQEGSALDHLKPGSALKILNVLGISNSRVSAAMNVESKRLGMKDIVFIEGKELSGKEIAKIALIGKGGTLNTIKECAVVRKEQIQLPQSIEGIIKCINPNCITNNDSIKTKFEILSQHPLKAKCFYCEARMEEKEIINSIK